MIAKIRVASVFCQHRAPQVPVIRYSNKQAPQRHSDGAARRRWPQRPQDAASPVFSWSWVHHWPSRPLCTQGTPLTWGHCHLRLWRPGSGVHLLRPHTSDSACLAGQERQHAPGRLWDAAIDSLVGQGMPYKKGLIKVFFQEKEQLSKVIFLRIKHCCAMKQKTSLTN